MKAGGSPFRSDTRAGTEFGGTAIQWKMGANDISDATAALNHWLDASARAR